MLKCSKCKRVIPSSEHFYSTIKITTLGASREDTLCEVCASELKDFLNTPRAFNYHVSEDAYEFYDCKADFIANLGVLLSQTREHIAQVVYRKLPEDKGEFADIVYDNGYIKSVNINMDSYAAIVRDVMKVVG